MGSLSKGEAAESIVERARPLSSETPTRLTENTDIGRV